MWWLDHFFQITYIQKTTAVITLIQNLYIINIKVITAVMVHENDLGRLEPKIRQQEMGVWQMSQQEPFPDFKSKIRDVLLDLQDPMFIALQYIVS